MAFRRCHVVFAPGGMRRALGLPISGPRRGRSPELLPTTGEVEQRGSRRVKPLAVGELGTRVSIFSLGDKLPAALEKGLGGNFVAARALSLRACRQRDLDRRERDQGAL